VYFPLRGAAIAVLLTGGNKQALARDILLAQRLASDF